MQNRIVIYFSRNIHVHQLILEREGRLTKFNSAHLLNERAMQNTIRQKCKLLCWMQLGLRQTRVWETFPNRKYTDYLCVPKRRLCCGLHNSEEKFVNRKRSALSLGSLQILMFLMAIFVPSCNNRLTTLKKVKKFRKEQRYILED